MMRDNILFFQRDWGANLARLFRISSSSLDSAAASTLFSNKEWEKEFQDRMAWPSEWRGKKRALHYKVETLASSFHWPWRVDFTRTRREAYGSVGQKRGSSSLLLWLPRYSPQVLMHTGNSHKIPILKEAFSCFQVSKIREKEKSSFFLSVEQCCCPIAPCLLTSRKKNKYIL